MKCKCEVIRVRKRFLAFIVTIRIICRNQEHLEHLKEIIAEKQAEENDFLQSSNRTKSVLNSIKLTIIDLIHKLQEVFVTTGSIEMETNETAPNHVILEVWNRF